MITENRENCFTNIFRFFIKLFTKKQEEKQEQEQEQKQEQKQEQEQEQKQENDNIQIADCIINIDQDNDEICLSPFNYTTCKSMFDDIIINDYDVIYNNLNVIKNIQVNNKLHVASDDKLTIYNTNMQALTRYIYGDTRQKSLDCINRTIKKAIKIDCFETLLDDTLIIGLCNLSITYYNDINFKNQISELINLIGKRE